RRYVTDKKGFTMLAYVEIASDAVDFREGRNDNGYWSVRRQKGFMHQGGPYPDPFEITLDEKQPPYAAGNYILAGGSFRNGKYGGLEFNRNVQLIPVADAIADLSKLTKHGARSGVAA